MRTLEEIRTFFAEDTFALQTCGISIDEVGDGTAICTMPLQQRHMNANHVAQGGAIFTLADFCFSVAANTGEGKAVSRNADIHFLRPATGVYLRAVAQRISAGRTVCLYRVDVYNDVQKAVAYITGTTFRIQ